MTSIAISKALKWIYDGNWQERERLVEDNLINGNLNFRYSCERLNSKSAQCDFFFFSINWLTGCVICHYWHVSSRVEALTADTYLFSFISQYFALPFLSCWCWLDFDMRLNGHFDDAKGFMLLIYNGFLRLTLFIMIAVYDRSFA